MKRLMLLGLIAAASFVLSPAESARAFTRPIMIDYDEIAPLAALSETGRRLQVTILGEPASSVRPVRRELLVVVEQEQTGAVALGRHRSPIQVDADLVPNLPDPLPVVAARQANRSREIRHHGLDSELPEFPGQVIAGAVQVVAGHVHRDEGGRPVQVVEQQADFHQAAAAEFDE